MALLFFLLLWPYLGDSRCPNDCSSNGYCNNENTCDCYPSYHGVDCSIRVCPSGTAWFDEPTADNVAHGAFRECSNMVLQDLLDLGLFVDFLTGKL